VIIWDCSSVLAKAKPLPEPAAKQLDAWWDSLADAKATSARHAMADLIAHPAAATRLLADRLKPDVAPDPKHVATLIRDLGDANFATRQRATDALVQLGDLALPALRKAQIADPDLETKRRLEVTISKATDVGYRKARAVAVLESIGDPVAARVLETLAKGITESRQTVEARQSLRRLGK
jgi:hypothetical protein